MKIVFSIVKICTIAKINIHFSDTISDGSFWGDPSLLVCLLSLEGACLLECRIQGTVGDYRLGD